MIRYGLELFDKTGKKTLSISDRVGHFLGFFQVPFTDGNTTTTYEFLIPKEHLNIGEIFIWYNPKWQTYQNQPFTGPDVTVRVTHNQDKISAYVSVKNVIQSLLAFRIFYGVM